MKINIFVFTAFVILNLLFGFILGTNQGIGMAMIHGPQEACEMLRFSILICK